MKEYLTDLLSSLMSVLQTITPVDIFDILVFTLVCYKGIQLLRDTRAGQLIKGIFLLLVVYLLSIWLEFKVLSFVLKEILDIGVLAIIIIFQPEIRRILEKFGQTKVSPNKFFGNMEINDEITKSWKSAISEIVLACEELSATTTGALIVIERRTKLSEQIATGTVINAAPSKELLGNIFYPKTPLHDGAVIIRDGVIVAAACFLPKPQNEEVINKKLGSRHRAAIGMSENSDALVIVVSEESGIISIAENGGLTRRLNSERLQSYLKTRLIPKPEKSAGTSKKLKKKLKGTDINDPRR
ncbi:MAG: diadenylate cyclase CdaA [Ruminococcus sp.]|jgi:diadenylate cyclase|nr:diadenylate cyclase CdaA [Ruminococcus sp.]